jgi:hypothetical protein
MIRAPTGIGGRPAAEVGGGLRVAIVGPAGEHQQHRQRVIVQRSGGGLGRDPITGGQVPAGIVGQ